MDRLLKYMLSHGYFLTWGMGGGVNDNYAAKKE
jgi:hypothetical protein